MFGASQIRILFILSIALPKFGSDILSMIFKQGALAPCRLKRQKMSIKRRFLSFSNALKRIVIILSEALPNYRIKVISPDFMKLAPLGLVTFRI